MPRPPVRATEKLAKAQRLGELKAERQFHKTKPLTESAREHIGKLIDNIHIDPIELAAVAGAAILVHKTIIGSEALLAKAQAALDSGMTWMYNEITGYLVGQLGYPAAVFPSSPKNQPEGTQVESDINGYYIIFMMQYTAPVLPGQPGKPVWFDVPVSLVWNKSHNGTITMKDITASHVEYSYDAAESWAKAQVSPESQAQKTGDIEVWLISIAIAYVLIHNSHQLLNIMETGLTAIIGLFLG